MKKTYVYEIAVKHLTVFKLVKELLTNRNILELTSFLFLIALTLTSVISLLIYFFKVLIELIYMAYFISYGYSRQSLKDMKEYIESHNHEHFNENVIHFNTRKKICGKMIKFLEAEGIEVDNPFDKYLRN